MKGFTLVEILVVTAITVMMTGFLVVNFSKTRMDMNQAALAIADAIRDAQSRAISGALAQGGYRCGYGVHFTASDYTVYAGPDSSVSGACAGYSREYNGVGTINVRVTRLANSGLEIATAPDIYFEPPNPTTYIGGATPGQATVYVRKIGSQCPSADCRSIYVSTSGQIQ